VTLEEKLNEMMSRPRGWDSYDGLPLAPETAEKVKFLVEAMKAFSMTEPSNVALGNSGGVSLEWYQHPHGHMLFVEVKPGEKEAEICANYEYPRVRHDR
jgi:hypothetical protein